MWSVSHSVTTAAPAEAIWRLWSDVSSWPAWNDDLASTSIDGPFAAGSHITMRPRSGDPVALRIAELVPGTSFVDEAVLGDTVVRTAHVLDPSAGGGTLVTYRMEITGPDAAAIGPAISDDFPATLEALVTLAAR